MRRKQICFQTHLVLQDNQLHHQGHQRLQGGCGGEVGVRVGGAFLN